MSPAAMLAAGVGGAAALGGALLAGWAAPGLPPAPSLALTHPRPAPVAALRRPGGDMLFALDGLRGELGADQASGPATPARRLVVYRPPPPPPPPDVALVFRQQVTAVVRRPGVGLAVLLSQPGQPSRLLRPGDAFDQQWRLVAITPSEAVLSDGVSERRVGLFSPPASQVGGSGGVLTQ